MPDKPSEGDTSLHALLPHLIQDKHPSLIVLDEDLRICHAEGKHADGLVVGDKATEQLFWLVGYEDHLQKLCRSEEQDLILNDIGIMPTDGGPVTYVAIRGMPAADGRAALLLLDSDDTTSIRAALMQQHNELKLIQSELVRARNTAEQATRAKSAFVANVSHELRTPLNIIIGNAEILGEHAEIFSEDERKKFAEDTLDSGKYLLQLVNDLLDLAKAEAGRLDLVEDIVDLRNLIESAITMVAGLPAAAPYTINVRLPSVVPAVYVDDLRLKQVLINLLTNAVNYGGGSGEILTTLEENEDGALICKISDRGPGMSAEELEQVMEPFVQGKRGGNNRAQGTGLGLPMVQSLVAMHGGKFEILSTPGSGTTAVVKLPAERVRHV